MNLHLSSRFYELLNDGAISLLDQLDDPLHIAVDALFELSFEVSIGRKTLSLPHKSLNNVDLKAS